MNEAEANRLRDAFENRRCVSAWLGCADVLFLGLGEDVLPRPKPGERHARPPYELETNFAAWRVDGESSAAWSESESGSGADELTAAAESLVGETVVTWELVAGSTLRLVFTGAKILTVEPWPRSDGISDAWSVASPDGLILAASNDGRLVVVESDVPIHDWFT